MQATMYPSAAAGAAATDGGRWGKQVGGQARSDVAAVSLYCSVKECGAGPAPTDDQPAELNL